MVLALNVYKSNGWGGASYIVADYVCNLYNDLFLRIVYNLWRFCKLSSGFRFRN